jgi:hypothetical protein
MGRRRQQAAKPIGALFGGLFKGSKAAASYLVNGAKKVLNRNPVRNPQVLPAMPQVPSIRPAVAARAAHRPVVGAPQLRPMPQMTPSAHNNNPADLMENFLSSVKSGIRRNVQEEFDLNGLRVNTPEEERDVEKSKSLLPTLQRAVTKYAPTFVNNLFDMIAGLVDALLGMFKVKDETKKMVTDAIKPLGNALFSTTPGQGLATLATAAAPTLIKMLTDFLGVNIAPDVAAAAAAFSQPAYTPATNANANANANAMNPANALAALAPPHNVNAAPGVHAEQDVINPARSSFNNF